MVLAVSELPPFHFIQAHFFLRNRGQVESCQVKVPFVTLGATTLTKTTLTLSLMKLIATQNTDDSIASIVIVLTVIFVVMLIDVPPK